MFTPRHPVTKPKEEPTAKAEAKLDIEALIEKAIEGTYIVDV